MRKRTYPWGHFEMNQQGGHHQILFSSDLAVVELWKSLSESLREKCNTISFRPGQSGFISFVWWYRTQVFDRLFLRLKNEAIITEEYYQYLITPEFL